MKNIRFIFSMLLLCFLLPITAQTYHDAVIFEAKGPVKSIQDKQFTYNFSQDGSVLSYTVNGETSLAKVFKRDADGYPLIYARYAGTDTESDRLTYQQFKYDRNRRIASKSTDESTMILTYAVIRSSYTYTYNTAGQLVKTVIYTNNEFFRSYEYYDIQCDERGNWISRKYKQCDTPNGEPEYKSESRTIEYWNSNGTSSAATTNSSPWQSLIGKKLLLTTYGLSQNGKEANQFTNQSGEYIQLQSNGILEWNKRNDGNTSYKYRIEGNKLYLTSQILGSQTRDRWFEIVLYKDNQIKTESNVGTYRYFQVSN